MNGYCCPYRRSLGNRGSKNFNAGENRCKYIHVNRILAKSPVNKNPSDVCPLQYQVCRLKLLCCQIQDKLMISLFIVTEFTHISLRKNGSSGWLYFKICNRRNNAFSF